MSDSKGKRRITRSPEHPALDLAAALDRARQFYKKEGLHKAPTDVALHHWGYATASSSANRTLAAVLHYGLLEAEGNLNDRQVRLSELGKDILLDEREESPERDEAIRQAALRPKVFAELWERFGPELPSDATLRTFLVRSLDFNPNAVGRVLSDFRKTVEFARLGEDRSPRPPAHGRSAFGNASGSGDSSEATDSSGYGAAKSDAPQAGKQSAGVAGGGDARATQTRHDELAFPLIGGVWAYLRVPVPLGEENYRLLMKLLEVIKPALTQADAQ